MTDGDLLVAAVLADPADDTARLAYADWLDENGHPGRAEFLRLQVAAPAPLTRREATAAVRRGAASRAAVLLYRHGPDWLAGDGDPAVTGRWAWSRGFVTDVRVTAEAWVAAGDRILARWPVRRVELVAEAFELEAGRDGGGPAVRLVGRERWHPHPAGFHGGPGGRFLLPTEPVEAADALRSVLAAEWPAVAEWAFR